MLSVKYGSSSILLHKCSPVFMSILQTSRSLPRFQGSELNVAVPAAYPGEGLHLCHRLKTPIQTLPGILSDFSNQSRKVAADATASRDFMR